MLFVGWSLFVVLSFVLVSCVVRVFVVCRSLCVVRCMLLCCP